ncbi:DUF6907 domain-containing protein [Streptomyces sp. NPDC007818]|uniref:DUF6907 domain-containing protein n=1 Tax=Streptomyces sp. NPDC007818 TaxID=3364780 RepID=UPI00369113CB
MSVALSESALPAVRLADLSAARRAAYEDGLPLLPRLGELGVHLARETALGDGAVSRVLHIGDSQWVISLPSGLATAERERIVSALFARELGVTAERPLVVLRRDRHSKEPFLTWCPQGCVSDHTSAMREGTMLEDISHDIGAGAALELPVWDAKEGTADSRVLSGSIRVEPHSSQASRRVPYVSLEVFMDEWMECLGPGELADVIQTLRAHLDVLDGLCGRLAEARRVYKGAKA